MEKPLKAKCRFCGKEIFSLYKSQLDYNHKAHELSCKLKEELKEDNNKKDVVTSDALKEKTNG